MADNNQNEIAAEKELLEAVAAGSEKAFRRLVEQYWRHVYFNVLTLVKSAETAQELTQDIFLKIWLQRDKLSAVTNFRTYIYVVARNQVISALRKKITGTVAIDASVIREDILLPDLQMEGKDAYRVLKEGIEQLTPQQRLIFNLSRAEGLSHEQIAERLNISKNTVKVHLVLALNTLRTWFRNRLDYLPLALLIWLMEKK